jgi:hypothetical protein
VGIVVEYEVIIYILEIGDDEPLGLVVLVKHEPVWDFDVDDVADATELIDLLSDLETSVEDSR